MTWIQFGLLGLINVVFIEWGLWRRQREIRRLLVVKGSVDSALTAGASRTEQVAGEVKELRVRVEIVERELKIR